MVMTMNEHQVEKLLSQHGDEISARRKPTFQPKRKVAWKPILVTGTAVVAIGVFILLPRNAEAARVQGIRKALKGVQSMEYWAQVRYNGNAWNDFIHSIRQGDFAWMRVAKSRSLGMTSISNQTSSMTDWDRLPFATIGKFDVGDVLDNQEDPLQIAITSYTGGNASEEYNVTTFDSAPRDNRPTYTLSYVSKGLPKGAIYTSTEDKQNFEILVDSKTNLPIESSYFRNTKGVTSEIKFQYAYNKTYPESLFRLETKKPILFPETERRKLAEKWSKVKIDGNHAPIYSASISPEGTIWIAFGVKEYEAVSSVPSEIVVSNGAKYVRGSERPYTLQPKDGENFGDRKDVIFTPFIPIYDSHSLPAKVGIKYAKRETYKDSAGSDEAKIVSVDLIANSWNIPSYFPSFNMGRAILEFPLNFWRTRAKARQELGDTLGAAKAFEAEADAYKNFVEYGGYKPLLEAAKCYESLGSPEKATALREHAAELQRTRIR